jgi:phosphoglycerol transferase
MTSSQPLLVDDASSSDAARVKRTSKLPGQILPYLALIALSYAILVLVLQLWKADLRIPFDGAGDVPWVQSWIQSVQENGWYLNNPRLGAPGGSEMYDFPMTENLHLFVIKLMGLIFRPSGLLFNMYVLLMYPVTACTTYFVLKKLTISDGLAFVGALLYAFLPYHFFRGHRHIFLASYYLAPFQIWMAIVVARGGLGASGSQPAASGAISGRQIGAMLLISFLVAAGGVYYAFFGCFFLMLAGIYAAVQWRGWRSLALALVLCAWTSLFTAVNLIPSFLYHREHGFNSEAVRRSHFESELYGLKVIQLLLPATNHRVAWLAELKNRYRFNGMLINENDAASLGIVAGIGFLWLLVQILRKNQGGDSERPGITPVLSIFNWGALLLATIGGFGSLFSFLATPWIRGYNRISVYIAFLGLTAILLVLEIASQKLRGYRYGKWLYLPALAGLLALGILDQTSPSQKPDHAALKKSFAARQTFVDGLEAALPPGAMIFQLPYVSYPEATGYGSTTGYDSLQLYLQSTTLRWSFGAVRGREGDSFNLMLATLPTKAMLEKVTQAGYQGVLIDRLTYRDLAARLSDEITAIVGAAPVDAEEHRWLFFPLADYKQKLQRGYSTEEWDKACTAMANPVVPLFETGFNPPEGSADNLVRWCKNRGEVVISNPGDVTRDAEFELDIDRPMGPQVLHIQYTGTRQDVQLGWEPKHLCFRVAVPPGKSRMHFLCEGAPYVEVHFDPRQIENIERAYRILGFHVNMSVKSERKELVGQTR